MSSGFAFLTYLPTLETLRNSKSPVDVITVQFTDFKQTTMVHFRQFQCFYVLATEIMTSYYSRFCANKVHIETGF